MFVFNIWIRKFIVQKDKGPVTIELQEEPENAGDPWNLLGKDTVEKKPKEPRITSFTASRYYVNRGDAVRLNWTIDPPGDFELGVVSDKQRVLLSEKQKSRGECELNVDSGKQDFILEAWAGQKPAIPDTRRLHIETVSLTHFENYSLKAPDWPNSPSVLGLYAHPKGGRLYALLRDNPPKESSGDNPPKESPYASLWYTEHGLEPSPDKWRKATRKDGRPCLIPTEAARRPGAIFNDKLFLIGGDCCDPNSSGSSVGFCDLNEDTGLYWQEVGGKEAWSWPEGMAERMGHAVVALPDDKGLWVMGGWRQDGGVCDDVWEFTGTKESAWSPVKGLKIPRCLFGATATRHAVWTVGGFGSPGGTPNDLTVRRCEHGANSWDRPPPDSEKWPKIPTSDGSAQYSASVLFSRERDTADRPLGIAAFWKETYERKYFYFNNVDNDNWQNSEYFKDSGLTALLPERKWYHIQSAVFRDAVFFRTLLPHEGRASNIITYLVFGPEWKSSE